MSRHNYARTIMMKDGVFTTSAFYPSNLPPHSTIPLFPLAGKPDVRTVLCNENGYFATYQSDSNGFRNAPSISSGKDVVLLGDSFVHGACIHNQGTISSKLQRYLDHKNVSVRNFGYGGTSTLHQYAILNEYLNLEKTAKVFWFIFLGNDYGEIKTEMKNPFLNEYLKNENIYPIQNLAVRKNEISNLIDEIAASDLRVYLPPIIDFYNLRRIYRTLHNALRNNPRQEDLQGLDHMSRILANAHHQLSNKGINTTVIILPSIKVFSNLRSNELKALEILKQQLESLDINYIDIYEELIKKNEASERVFPDGRHYHYTAEFYDRIARHIYKSEMDN